MQLKSSGGVARSWTAARRRCSVTYAMNPSGAEGGDPKTPPQQINFLEEAAARRGAAVGHRAGPDSIGEKNRRENSDEKKSIT